MTPRHLAWQAWHLATYAFASRGRRGTWRHLRQAWHLRHWAGSGVALGLGLVAGDAAALCVAGVALGDMCLRFTWQAWHLATSAWHLRHWAGSGGALGLGGTLRGRRGTWRHVPSFHVAGVALGDIYLRFTWQAWHLRRWAGSGGAGDAAALCMAGVAVGDNHLRFTWQAWHLAASIFVSRGRRGT